MVEITSVIVPLTCLIEFLSLNVTVWSFIVSKSMVIPNGVPNSSLRAYFLPIEVLESSILKYISLLRKACEIFLSIAGKLSLFDIVVTNTLIGAICNGKEKNLLTHYPLELGNNGRRCSI